MKSVVVVGAQWGDEGKGKVVDYLAGSFDYIARVAGGHNAGHTVIIGKDKYVLQLIPCGILRPKQHAVIGTGVVIDPARARRRNRNAREGWHRSKGSPTHQQSRAFDLSVSSRTRQSRRNRPRREQNRNDVPRNRAGLRRQDGATRLAHVRLAGTRTVSEKAARVVAEKNRLAKGAYGADIDFSHEVERDAETGRKDSRIHLRYRGTHQSRAGSTVSPCCLRARRAPCWTSIMARIRM